MAKQWTEALLEAVLKDPAQLPFVVTQSRLLSTKNLPSSSWRASEI